MRRQEFIAGIGSAAAWPVVALAQQPALPVIGFVNMSSADASAGKAAAFRGGLGESGYVDRGREQATALPTRPAFCSRPARRRLWEPNAVRDGPCCCLQATARSFPPAWSAAHSRLGKDVRVIRIVRRGETSTPDGSRHQDIVLEDHCGEIAALYRPGDAEVVLLRPDGHVGWRAARPDAIRLSEWLSTALGAHKEAPRRDGISPVASDADVAWQQA